MPQRATVRCAQAVYIASKGGSFVNTHKLRLRAGTFAVCAAIAGGVAGGALAQDDPGSGGLASDEAQAIQSANLDQATLRAMWEATAEKAESGDLAADVDGTEAAVTLRAAMDPPHDPQAANDLEAKMIELTATLHESGDLPAYGDEEAFMEYAPATEEAR